MAETYVVKSITGHVYVKGTDGTQRILKVGDTVHESEVIVTAQGASVQLESGTGFVAEISPDSAVVLAPGGFLSVQETQKTAQAETQPQESEPTPETVGDTSHSFAKISRTEYQRDHNLEYGRDVNVTEDIEGRASANPRVRFAFSVHKEYLNQQDEYRLPFDGGSDRNPGTNPFTPTRPGNPAPGYPGNPGNPTPEPYHPINPPTPKPPTPTPVPSPTPPTPTPTPTPTPPGGGGGGGGGGNPPTPPKAHVDDVDSVKEDDKTTTTGNIFTNDGHKTDTIESVKIGEITVTVNTGEFTEIKGEYGTLKIYPDGKYEYALDNASEKVQALGVHDENIKEEFTISLGDNCETKLTINVAGTNDAPEITGRTYSADGGNLTESNAALLTSGTIAVKDVDTGDSLVLSVTKLVATGGTGSGLTIEQETALATQLQNSLTFGGDNTTWNFNSGSQTFDFLPKDKTLTLTYTVQVKDGSNATDTEDIKIIIKGTNDAPVITGLTYGSDVGKLTETDAALKTSGTFTVTDADIGDTVTLSVSSFTAFTADEATAAILTDTQKTQLAGLQNNLTFETNNGVTTWKFNSGSQTFDFLPAGKELTLTYTVQAKDISGAIDTKNIVITITGTNDLPTAVNDTPANIAQSAVGVPTSLTGNVLTNDTDPDNGEKGTLKVVSFTVDGGTPQEFDTDTTKYENIEIKDSSNTTIGKITIESNGAYTFTPEVGYSGRVPVIDYTIEDAQGEKSSAQLIIGVNNAPVTTPEDTAVGMQLAVPAVAGETIGAIELKGIPNGAQIMNGSTDITNEINSGTLKIIITGAGIHPVDIPVTGAVTMTADQFKALTITPPPDSSENFKMQLYTKTGGGTESSIDVQINVTAITDDVDIFFKSDAITNPPSGVATFTSSALGAGTATGSATITAKEGTAFDLSKLIDKSFTNPTGSTRTGESNDTNEVRTLELSGLSALPAGTTYTIDGKVVTPTSGVITITLTNPYTIPTILVSPPAYSAVTGGSDLGTIGIKLTGQDTGAAANDIKSDSISLTINYIPQGGDVGITIPGEFGKEDIGVVDANGNTVATGIHFLKNLVVTDNVSRGGVEDTTDEVITEIKVLATSIKDGWKICILDGEGKEQELTANTNGYYTISVDDKDDYYLTPPATTHYSGIIKPEIHVTTQDGTSGVGANAAEIKVNDEALGYIKTTIFNETGKPNSPQVEFVVRPVAERIPDGVGAIGEEEGGGAGHAGIVSDAPDTNNNNDLTMTKGHKYGTGVTAGKEDGVGFQINQGGFNLNAASGNPTWNNPDKDGSEETYAILTPRLVDGYAGSGGEATNTGTGNGIAITGGYFTTDGGVTKYESETIKGSSGDPVIGFKLPLSVLNDTNLQYVPPANAYGEFEIKVQAYTVDTIPGYSNSAISGEAWLKGIVVTPTAESIVSLSVASPAVGSEDTALGLQITPQSKNGDPNEKFTVTISSFPVGVTTVTYNTQTYNITDGKVEIANFDSSKLVSFTPPQDWSGTHTLSVTAVSVATWTQTSTGTTFTDVFSGTDVTKLDIVAVVRGVPDVPTLTVTGGTITEGVAEKDGISIKDMITEAKATDKDGSETITLRLTGLDEGFSITGARLVVGGSGGDRVWLVDPKDMENIKITVPQNYSGDVKLTVIPITTENDGASTTWTDAAYSKEIIISVTPTPEATINLSAEATEDKLSQVLFDIKYQNGDTDETLDAVYIKKDDLTDNFTLYVGNGADKVAVTTLETKTFGEGVDAVVYYKLTYAQSQAVYVQGGDEISGKFEFGVKYDIIDPGYTNSTGGFTSVGSSTPTTSDGTYTYKLIIAPETDPTTMKGLAGGTGSSASGVQYGDFLESSDKISVTGTTVTVVSTGNDKAEFSVKVTVNAPADKDGSENLRYLIIKDVPDGVKITNTGAIYYGDNGNGSGYWSVPAPASGAVFNAANSAAGIPVTLTFLVDTGSKNLWNLADDKENKISISAVTQDTATGLANATELEGSATNFDMIFNFGAGEGPGTGYAPAGLVISPGGGTIEDSGNTTLRDLMKVKVNDAVPDDEKSLEYRFSIVIGGLPEGTVLERGMLDVEIGKNGNTGTYTLTGFGDEKYINTALQNIKVTFPENFNDNNAVGGTNLSVSWTVKGEGAYLKVDDGGFVIVGGEYVAYDEGTHGTDVTRYSANTPLSGTPSVNYTVTPVTDVAEMKIIVSPGLVESQVKAAETGLTSTKITLNLTNDADGNFAQVVGGKVYIAVAGLQGGTLVSGANATTQVTFTTATNGIPAGTYYVLDVGSSTSEPLELTYYPKQYWSGTVDLKAFVLSQEANSINGDIKVSSSNMSFAVEPKNSAVTVEHGELKGNEDSLIELKNLKINLADKDDSEYVTSVSISGVPNGALVYVGDSEGNMKLAMNSGSGVWLISQNDGSLYDYVAIKPQPNFSGDLELKLVVLAGETALAPTTQEIDIKVSVLPVADGVTINPTQTFGTAGDYIPLNINNSMMDTDGSEKLYLELKGIGLGANALFYVLDGSEQKLLTDLGATAEYNSTNNTWVIGNIGYQYAMLDKLSFVSETLDGKGTIDVKAWTVDTATIGGVAETSAPSDAVTGKFTYEIDPAPVVPGGDDGDGDGNEGFTAMTGRFAPVFGEDEESNEETSETDTSETEEFEPVAGISEPDTSPDADTTEPEPDVADTPEPTEPTEPPVVADAPEPDIDDEALSLSLDIDDVLGDAPDFCEPSDPASFCYVPPSNIEDEIIEQLTEAV